MVASLGLFLLCNAVQRDDPESGRKCLLTVLRLGLQKSLSLLPEDVLLDALDPFDCLRDQENLLAVLLHRLFLLLLVAL